MNEVKPPVYQGDEERKKRRRKYHLIPITRFTAGAMDSLFFVFAGLAATVLTLMIFTQGFQHTWRNLLFLFLFWAVTAYLTLTKTSYPEAPVSPLTLFGGVQAFAYQLEVDGNPGKRHHVRFWRSPEGWVLPGGQKVDWVAAATYDTGVGFSFFTLQITHRIDAETDYERDFIVDTIRFVDPSTQVQIIEDFSTGYHSRNGGGDSIVTDGNLPIISLYNKPPRRIVRDDLIDLYSATDIARKMPMNVLIGTVMAVLWAIAQCALLLYRMRNPIDLSELTVFEPEFQKLIDWVGLHELQVISQYLLPATVVLFTAVQLILAYRLLNRSSRARIFTLDLLALAFIFQLARVYVWGMNLELTTVIGQMYILVFAMLAYTSEQARRYTEKPKTQKTPWLTKREK